VDKYKLYDAEMKFMTLIWENEPINSTDLVKLCREHLGWKKSTTYTVLRKLRERGVLQNESALVTSLVSQAQVQKFAGEHLVNRTFQGSLPRFLTAFLEDRTLSAREAAELKKIIDQNRGGD
jgi:BlaI family transcriptional regulator, penicillinase repressor